MTKPLFTQRPASLDSVEANNQPVLEQALKEVQAAHLDDYAESKTGDLEDLFVGRNFEESSKRLPVFSSVAPVLSSAAASTLSGTLTSSAASASSGPPTPPAGATSTPPQATPGIQFDPEPYQARFLDKEKSGDFYLQLTEELVACCEKNKSGGYKGKIKSMLDLVEYFRQGALKDKEDKKDLESDDPNKVSASQKYETMDLLYRKLQSLRDLAASNTLYTEAQYEKMWNEIQVLLDKQGVDEKIQKQLKEEALDAVIKDNLFTKRKIYETRWGGNTGFDTTQDTYKTKEKYSKRVKIEHEGGTVTGTFSYNRSVLLGTRPLGGHLKLWGGSKDELSSFQTQMKEFVSVAINEYGKGSQANPINLHYTKKPIPEAALGVLMEFKNEAIRRGQPFYAMHNGKKIEITASHEFTDDEKKYFSQYATAKPKTSSYYSAKDKEANACAAYKLYKHVKVDVKEGEKAGGPILTQANAGSEEKLFEAMSAHLAQTNKKYEDAKNKRLAETAKELSKPKEEEKKGRGPSKLEA